VDITKAYKSYVATSCFGVPHFQAFAHTFTSLTDETIRRNWELYGHPDGRQEVSMGIALPQWIIEGKNNIWVLGMYGIVFGGVLPFLVVRLHIDLSCFHLRDSRFCTFVLVLLTVTYSGSMVVRQPTKNKGWCKRSYRSVLF
jgi:hypothetical protein